jgi:hypothetical protein
MTPLFLSSWSTGSGGKVTTAMTHLPTAEDAKKALNAEETTKNLIETTKNKIANTVSSAK